MEEKKLRAVIKTELKAEDIDLGENVMTGIRVEGECGQEKDDEFIPIAIEDKDE